MAKSKHKYADELQTVSDAYQNLMDIGAALPGELGAVKIRINKVKQDQAFIHSLLGSARELQPEQSSKLPHMTHINGKPIAVHAPVKPGDITPTSAEQKKFKAEVDDWYGNFLNLPDDKVMSKNAMPGGNTIIRAVAKMAGYADYAQEVVDYPYIQAVKKAIEAKNAQADNAAKAAATV